LTSEHSLRSLFTAQSPDSLGNLDEGGVLFLEPQKNDQWLMDLSWAKTVFPDSIQKCYRCLVPLVNVQNSICELIGFVILDNPYPHFIETKYTPGLARMFCDLFAPHLANRGAGHDGWIERVWASRRSLDAICNGAPDDSPDSESEFERIAAEYLQSFRES